MSINWERKDEWAEYFPSFEPVRKQQEEPQYFWLGFTLLMVCAVATLFWVMVALGN